MVLKNFLCLILLTELHPRRNVLQWNSARITHVPSHCTQHRKNSGWQRSATWTRRRSPHLLSPSDLSIRVRPVVFVASGLAWGWTSSPAIGWLRSSCVLTVGPCFHITTRAWWEIPYVGTHPVSWKKGERDLLVVNQLRIFFFK